jgi:Delta7-sterol 5-desaturase
MTQFFTVWATMLACDGGRYVVVVGMALLVFWWWGRDRFRHRLIRGSYAPASSMKRELLYSASTALIFSANGVALWYGTRVGIFRVARGFGDRGWAYFSATLVILIILHDTYFYWTHRAMHHPRLFKIVHRTHHLSTNPSPCAAYAFAPAEAFVQAAYVPLIALVMPTSDVALFLFLLFMICRNVMGHLGLELFPKTFMQRRWLRFHTTTTHHGMHHHRFHGNYGLYFTFWDRVMGTMHASYETEFERLTVKRKINADGDSDHRSENPNDRAATTSAL